MVALVVVVVVLSLLYRYLSYSWIVFVSSCLYQSSVILWVRVWGSYSPLWLAWVVLLFLLLSRSHASCHAYAFSASYVLVLGLTRRLNLFSSILLIVSWWWFVRPSSFVCPAFAYFVLVYISNYCARLLCCCFGLCYCCFVACCDVVDKYRAYRLLQTK